MPRTIQISVAPQTADALQSRFQRVQGVVGLARHRGASIDPPGDLLIVQACNDSEPAIFTILEEMRVQEEGAILSSQPLALLTAKGASKIEAESNEAVWEEMAFHLRGDTNVDFNYCAMMMLAGAVAAVGLWADMLHIVIGAMVIAPAYEPLVRLPFGLIVGPRRLMTGGLRSTAAGYLLLILGAVVAVLILRVVDSQATLDLESRRWVRYWSSFSPPGVVVSIFAAMAGAVIISGLRSVMTTGVMIALALIPSMSVVGMALATGDVSLAGGGLARWAVDAALVIVVSAVVIGSKQKLRHHRNSLE